MEGDLIKINSWLLPLSWLYGIGVKFRNFLFNVGIIKSRSFDIPIISVGNITVGGSGKTPHVEYLIRLLQDKFRLAVLSRGYKRHSKGFILADETATGKTIGDEPFQMKRKFPDITVAVDKKRCHGIDMLAANEKTKDLDVILLDDAYQHRYVNPGINILLVDYHRIIKDDKLLPAGRLREPASEKIRANIVIVTKCPNNIKPMDFRVLIKAMDLYPYQNLYFTTFVYDSLQPVFSECKPFQIKQDTTEEEKPNEYSSYTKALNYRLPNVLLLTGIASPQQMKLDLQPCCDNITPLAFSDHHDFTSRDVDVINNTFASMTEPKLIVTTEKDESRIIDLEGLSDDVRAHLYTLPLKIRFMENGEQSFNNNIIGYVRKNSKNSILTKTNDDNNKAKAQTIYFKKNS